MRAVSSSVTAWVPGSGNSNAYWPAPVPRNSTWVALPLRIAVTLPIAAWPNRIGISDQLLPNTCTLSVAVIRARFSSTVAT